MGVKENYDYLGKGVDADGVKKIDWEMVPW